MSDETRLAPDASEDGAPAEPEASVTTDVASDDVSIDVPPAFESPGGTVLRGATVSPGLALGRVHRKDYDLSHAGTERVPLDEVDLELNRFRRALDESRRQITDLKGRLDGRVPADDARILDTHLIYLSDSVFIADVENLILNEQMRLDAAIAKVVGDFDRIFRLVQSDTIRQSAIDLRDVGIRVLRNLERESSAAGDEGGSGDYILVARELSIVDMFNLANEHVKGIVTKEGGLSSHAATFARAMRIPTLTGVESLLEVVRENDFVILDATEGLVRVNPSELIRQQYDESSGEDGGIGGSAIASEVPDWALETPCTLDQQMVTIAASAGNLPEVETANEYGMDSVGVYRTELLYLIDREPPTREALVQHYTSVIGAARGAAVTFRLLNVDSSVGIPYLHREPERNPSLGAVGIRALLANPRILRRQVRAILVAGHDSEVRIALPFVTDCGDLRRVKEIVFEERLELRKRGERFNDHVQIGVVIETPTAMLGIRDLALEADFLMVNLDSLQQYLMAVDRENPANASAFEVVHPFVLRALAKATDVAQKEARPLWVFGPMAQRAENLPFLIGAGLRHFCVAPAEFRVFLAALRSIDGKTVARATRAAARSSCAEETVSVVAGYRHGYAPN